MSEELLIALCAPTLADLKTGSLFTCPVDDPARLRESIRRYNAQLVPKGLCLLPMRIENGRMLLYLYRPSRGGRAPAPAGGAPRGAAAPATAAFLFLGVRRCIHAWRGSTGRRGRIRVAFGPPLSPSVTNLTKI